MTVAENIKRIRKDRHLTQKQLGELCGIAESTIRRYELGLLNPKLETIQKIADALKVNIYEIDERIKELKFKYLKIRELEKTIQEFKIAASCESPSGKDAYDKFIKQYSNWIENTENEISEMQAQLGNIHPDLLFQEQRLLKLFSKLNYSGRQRALEDVENLTFIPKYQTNPDVPTLNAAHADDYTNAPEKLKQLEEDIMDDENF